MSEFWNGLSAWLDQPPLVLAIILLLIGLYGLALGANRLLDGAIALAQRTGLSRAVIGATVVAFGTSAPELVIGLSAAVRAAQTGEIAADGPIAITVANVIGASIANLGLILGITCVITQVAVDHTARHISYPAVVVAVLCTVVVAWPWSGTAAITRPKALLLVGLLVVSAWLAVRDSRRFPDRQVVAEVAAHGSGIGMGPAWWLTISGLLLLTVAGQATLSGAIGIAQVAGLSERVIGLTVISIGTAMPELFASITAARRGHADLALGNVLGSAFFNLAGILGTVGLIVSLPINAGTLDHDVWWLIGFVAMVGWWVVRAAPFTRIAGIVLLSGYVAYLVALSVHST